jgi:hypothetical protein
MKNKMFIFFNINCGKMQSKRTKAPTFNKSSLNSNFKEINSIKDGIAQNADLDGLFQELHKINEKYFAVRIFIVRLTLKISFLLLSG